MKRTRKPSSLVQRAFFLSLPRDFDFDGMLWVKHGKNLAWRWFLKGKRRRGIFYSLGVFVSSSFFFSGFSFLWFFYISRGKPVKGRERERKRGKRAKAKAQKNKQQHPRARSGPKARVLLPRRARAAPPPPPPNTRHPLLFPAKKKRVNFLILLEQRRK